MRPSKKIKLAEPEANVNVEGHPAFQRLIKVIPGSEDAKVWMDSLRERGIPPGGWDRKDGLGEGEEDVNEDSASETIQEKDKTIKYITAGPVNLSTFVRAVYMHRWCALLGMSSYHDHQALFTLTSFHKCMI